MDTVDVVVVGAGVVGLAIARAFALQGRETLILEAAEAFGTETSSRNSEVIHAGIYYPRGSLKARLCVAGRDRLYAFCDRWGVPYRRCGKLIVATSEAQLAELNNIRAAAQANGVELELLPRAAALSLEPELSCVGALHSPLTGIIDSHSYMLALLGQAEEHGATLVCGTRVTRLVVEPAREPTGNRSPVDFQPARRAANGPDVGSGVLICADGQEEPSLRARWVINSAGLHAPHVARAIEGFPAQHVPTAYFAKGNYFTLGTRSPFQRLVYPVPEPGGLGVHLTLDLAGRARFGPDVQWVEDCEDYAVDPRRAQRFYAAIRSYWPRLEDGALQPAYSGIRPKISAPTEPAPDFRIEGPETHGVPGIVNLFGIESPGLTASLAIADEVVALAASD